MVFLFFVCCLSRPQTQFSVLFPTKCTTFPFPTEPALVLNQNNIFKNSVNIEPSPTPPTRQHSLLAIHVFRCTLYHGGDASGGAHRGNSIKNLMHSLAVAGKLLFADNRDVYRGRGWRESGGAEWTGEHMQIAFLSDKRSPAM